MRQRPTIKLLVLAKFSRRQLTPRPSRELRQIIVLLDGNSHRINPDEQPARELNVLVADPHPVLRIGVAIVLRQISSSKVDQVSSMSELYDYLELHTPDVLLLEPLMADGNALESMPHIRRLCPDLPVLVLSSESPQTGGVRAIISGATGYVCKTESPAHVLTAVERVAAGQRYVSSALGDALAEYLMRSQSEAAIKKLSNREFQVLLGISRGFTGDEIGVQLGLSGKTIGTFRSRLLEKLGISTTAGLTTYVVEHGLDPEPRRALELTTLSAKSST